MKRLDARILLAVSLVLGAALSLFPFSEELFHRVSGNFSTTAEEQRAKGGEEIMHSSSPLISLKRSGQIQSMQRRSVFPAHYYHRQYDLIINRLISPAIANLSRKNEGNRFSSHPNDISLNNCTFLI
jgi:hypothetical protein